MMRWLVLVAGCASEPAVERATWGELELATPSGWKIRDASRHGTSVAMWTPDDNANRESITLLHTQPMPEMSNAGAETVRHLLEQAQSSLSHAAFGRPIQFRSKTGLLGVSVEGTFTPPGQDHSFRRIHAVLFERTSLVHVIFTAGTADANEEPFHIVLDSLHRKEG